MEKSKLILTSALCGAIFSTHLWAADCNDPEGLLIASVRSEGQPQNGQKHRSSGNFSTQNAVSGFNKFCWVVSNTNVPNSVKFDVKQDKSFGSDPTKYSNVVNGSVTTTTEKRSLYIANPKGANSGDFTVTVYGVNK